MATLICEVGQTIGVAASGLAVKAVRVDGVPLQHPTAAVLKCNGFTHQEPLDVVGPSPDGGLIMQYPAPGPCQFGGSGHPTSEDTGSDPVGVISDAHPGYHIEITIESGPGAGTYSSDTIHVYDILGNGYPKPPMSP